MTNSSLNAADLDGSNGFFIQGLEAWKGLGFSVSSAGDINGDGIDDLIIGAVNFYTDSDSPGKTYVIFGSTDVGTGGSFDLSSLDGTNGFVLYASMESRFLGNSVITLKSTTEVLATLTGVPANLITPSDFLTM